MVNGKTTDTKQPWKKIHEVIDNDYFEKSDVKFPGNILLKFNKEFNEFYFIPVTVRK